jgi:isopenicillin-N epimerase
MDFLNHGSFGAAPKAVLAAQDAWRAQMNAQPVEFLSGRLPKLLRGAAGKLADFLNVRADDLVFVDNATCGVNTVLRSLDWRRGDEILLSSHSYPAVKNAARHISRVAGAVLREARVPFPPQSSAAITGAFAKALTRRTRLAIVDHVASPTALIFPVREIAALCREAGSRVLVDGAHAPGMLALDVAALGADWYVGNCHKWLFAPKGCAFLWAARSAKEGLHPLAISNHYGEGFLKEFDWCGTREPSAWLAVESALAFHRGLGAGALLRRNHGLAVAMGRRLARAWGVAMPPEELCGAMVSLPLPFYKRPSREDVKRLHDALWRRKIEVPFFNLGGRLLIRISAQAYNGPADYDKLAQALPALIGKR